ncbi:Zinc transporter ZupT [Symbiodinium microadriaticum]|uniref:Zinc transporter ZupT n=1 Tax=Symbiodinium microadriaticum TaxID=2951 RepID=A0A1Q9CKG9_SYMMI|nr:Zinc transporter ZupT [Symbiodinium microadriaticum]
MIFQCIVWVSALHLNEISAGPELSSPPQYAGEDEMVYPLLAKHLTGSASALPAIPDLPEAHEARTADLEAHKATAIMRSLVAGLSTSLGAGIVLLLRSSPTASQMAFALALAAGAVPACFGYSSVMLTVSFVELFIPPFVQAENRFQACASGIFGFLSFLLLRKLVPEPDMGCGKKDEERRDDPEKGHVGEVGVEPKARQFRLAFLMMLALTAHNFPEGLAVGVSSLQSAHLGVVVMAAIAVHNIPEGIAIALPVLEATNSRSWAMLLDLDNLREDALASATSGDYGMAREASDQAKGAALAMTAAGDLVIRDLVDTDDWCLLIPNLILAEGAKEKCWEEWEEGAVWEQPGGRV